DRLRPVIKSTRTGDHIHKLIHIRLLPLGRLLNDARIAVVMHKPVLKFRVPSSVKTGARIIRFCRSGNGRIIIELFGGGEDIGLVEMKLTIDLSKHIPTVFAAGSLDRVGEIKTQTVKVELFNLRDCMVDKKLFYFRIIISGHSSPRRITLLKI